MHFSIIPFCNSTISIIIANNFKSLQFNQLHWDFHFKMNNSKKKIPWMYLPLMDNRISIMFCLFFLVQDVYINFYYILQYTMKLWHGHYYFILVPFIIVLVFYDFSDFKNKGKYFFSKKINYFQLVNLFLILRCFHRIVRITFDVT